MWNDRWNENNNLQTERTEKNEKQIAKWRKLNYPRLSFRWMDYKVRTSGLGINKFWKYYKSSGSTLI